MDQAHVHIANKGTELTFEKQSIFPVEDNLFQSPFTDVIGGAEDRHLFIFCGFFTIVVFQRFKSCCQDQN
jgi:hypothetical protein